MSIESPFFILSEDSQPARCSNIAATSQVATASAITSCSFIGQSCQAGTRPISVVHGGSSRPHKRDIVADDSPAQYSLGTARIALSANATTFSRRLTRVIS